MGVTSMIALASQLASMTGLGGKVGQWLAGEKGEEVASRGGQKSSLKKLSKFSIL